MFNKLSHIITRSLLFSIIFTTVFGLALGIYLFHKNTQYESAIYPNVYVNGVSFEGSSKQDVENYFEPINSTLRSALVEITYDENTATFSGEMLELAYDTDVIYTQAYSVGRSGGGSSELLLKLATLLNLDSIELTHRPHYDLGLVQEHLTELDEAYSVPPENALFEISNGRVTAFKAEEPGVVLQTQPAIEHIEQFLGSKSAVSGDVLSVTIEATTVEPDITLAETNDLGILEKIGEGKSDYSGSIPSRIHNLELAASQFHGVLIPPGEIFSFNEIVGDISASTGYKAAYIIKNGRTVLGDGGGVCQDSTTLFRAALNTGLPIIERYDHAYRVKYYENDRKPGFDATVYAPSVDLKFKNDTPAHILIQSHVDKANNILRFEFWGKSDGRTVELSDATVYDIRPAPPPKYEDSPTLPAGVVEQVDWAAPGARSYFHYKVTAADGAIIQDKTFYSNYRPWQAVYLVGTGE